MTDTITLSKRSAMNLRAEHRALEQPIFGLSLKEKV